MGVLAFHFVEDSGFGYDYEFFGVACFCICEYGGGASHEVCDHEDVLFTFGVCEDGGLGVLFFEGEDTFEGEFFVDVACSVPEDHVFSSSLFLEVCAEVAVGGEDNFAFRWDGVDDGEGVGGGAADVREGFYFGCGVDVGDDQGVGVLGSESCEFGSGA